MWIEQLATSRNYGEGQWSRRPVGRSAAADTGICDPRLREKKVLW